MLPGPGSSAIEVQKVIILGLLLHSLNQYISLRVHFARDPARHWDNIDMNKIDLFSVLIALPSSGAHDNGKREKLTRSPGERGGRKVPGKWVRILTATQEAQSHPDPPSLVLAVKATQDLRILR